MAERRVTVFCASTPKVNTRGYLDLARDFGRRLAEAGFHCVNGGSMGMLEEVSRGCHESGGTVHCVSLERFPMSHRFYTHHESFPALAPRQQRLIELGDAFVALPGGVGTLHEVFEILAKKGAREIPLNKPMICLGGDFDFLMMLLNERHGAGFVREELDELVTHINDRVAVIERLQQYFAS